MDDLILFLHRVQSINSLTLIFQEYEQRTEAKLNYNKCFVLLTEKNPWIEMPLANYLKEEIVYLEIIISWRMNPTKDWEGMIKKIQKVGTAIKQKKGSFNERV